VSRGRDTVVQEFLASAIAMIRATTGVGAAIDSTVPPSGTKIAVVVGARGALSGITWVFPQAIIHAMIRRAIPGAENRASLRDAAATELANILTGRCAETLSLHGIHVEIEPPHVTHTIEEGVKVHLATELGTIDIVLHPRRTAA
jgi:CheY-specific phosphatase CheX